jgi:hypothetical protein
MILGSVTFGKIRSWIRLNKNISITAQHRLSLSFKKFVTTLPAEEQNELIYSRWLSDNLELTDSGYKAITRMAELLDS